MAKQYKFQKRMKDLGLTENDLSIKMKAQVAETNELLELMHKRLESTTDEDEKTDTLNDIEAAESEMIKSLEKYAKNKPRYDEMAKKLADAREAKKNGGTPPVVIPPVVVPPVVDEVPPVVEEPVVVEPVVIEPVAEVPVEAGQDGKKKGNGVWMFVGIIGVAIAGVVGFNYISNR